MSECYDAIVVGGGVNGSAIAYNLAKRGLKVILLEKDRLASKASSAAAGMLAAQAELEKDGPLFQLAKKSRSMFPNLAVELKERSGIDIELVQKGLVKIASSQAEVQEFQKMMEAQQQAGETVEWMTGKQLCEKEPALSPNLLGGMYIPNDGQLSPFQLSHAFAKSAASYGAEIREFTEVHSFIHRKGKITGVVTGTGKIYGNHVVVAGGAWSDRLLQESGLILKSYPVKGECFSIISPRPLLTATIFSHDCYLVPKKGGRTLVGATSTPDTFDQSVTLEGIHFLIEKAKKLVPVIMAGEWERAWAGIRPQSLDGLPYLGEHPVWKHLWIATGHFRNGILLSAITGELVADMLEEKTVQVDLSAFSIDRVFKTV